MFIHSTIFKGELFIPFPTDNNSCVNTDSLDWFIDNYEQQILRQLLGGKLYVELVERFVNETIVVGDEWFILLNGGEYFCPNGDSFYWKGLKYQIACFIYFYITRENAILTTNNGGKVNQYELAENVAINIKGINNWNNATRLTKRLKCSNTNGDSTLLHYLDNNDFSEFDYCVNFYEKGLINQW